MDSNVLRSLPETGTSRFTSDNEQSLVKKEAIFRTLATYQRSAIPNVLIREIANERRSS